MHTRCPLTQRLTPERGFSSAKFVPGSKDQTLLAIKSAESAATGATSSYISVVTMDGRELMPEVEIPGGLKFEGVAFYTASA
jgi:soluble calcium-activated nucleotidase 1